MSALVLKGYPVAARIRDELAAPIEQFRKAHGVAPTLAVVRVGHPPAAVSYSHSIDRALTESAMGFQMHALPEEAGEEQLLARLSELARASDVHGILLQRPLPRSINLAVVLRAFPVEKDVEGITPRNIGDLAVDTGPFIPTSTPSAALEILNYYDIPLEGKDAVIIGRSNILGKPMGLLLLRANATVTITHSHTHDLPEITRRAELLIAAVGRAGFVTADMVSPGAIVVDFGINPHNGRFVGDVDFDAVREIASALTPVPGGTGPVTTMMLMRNTLRAAEVQASQAESKGPIKWLPILKSPKRHK